MRPSYLDRKQEQPASGTPTLKDHVSNEYANQGEIDERNAALAKVADLEQALASAQGELHRMTARADEAIEQMRPTHESLARFEAENAALETEKAALEAELAEANEQIAELTKPKETANAEPPPHEEPTAQ